MNEIYFNEIINFLEYSTKYLELLTICKDSRLQNRRKVILKLHSANKLKKIVNEKGFKNILTQNLSLLHSNLQTSEEYTFTLSDVSEGLLDLYQFPVFERYDEYAELYDYKTIQQKTVLCYNRTFEDSLEEYSYVINHDDMVCAVYRVPFYLYWCVRSRLSLKALVY